MSSPFRRFVSRMAWEWGDSESKWRSVDGSLLFVDISGFTALSERLAARGRIGAEELTRVLGRVFGAMLDAVHARGGTLLKFGGDALLLLFDSEDHPMQAAAAVVEMRAALREAAKERTSVGRISLRMSSGIHSGPVDLFLVGHSHQELIVGGPTASMTTVMEADADASEIVVSPHTASLLPPDFIGDAKGSGLLLRKRRIHHPLPAFDRAPDSPDELKEGLVPVGLRETMTAGAADSEHRIATVGFIGFGGLDEMLARSGEEAAEALESLVGTVQEAVDAEGVTFLASDVAGDGGKIILSAGVPVARGDDEGRILRAARRILDSEQKLDVRIGLNRGHVFAGTIGEKRATYTVMGDTVNLAARLMTAAPYGRLYAHPSVLDRSSTLFRTKALDSFEVKGKTAAVEAYDVAEETGARPQEATAELVFTGRDDELTRLSEALATPGSTVAITGDSGIGKTRLITEGIARDPDTAIFTAQGEPARSESPYWAVRDSLRELLGIETATQQKMRTRLEQAIDAIAPDLVSYLPLIGDATQIVVEDTPETRDLDSRFRPSKTGEVVTSLLERMIPDRLAIIAEDAHWMDELSLGLISMLGAEAEKQHWCVIVTGRPDESGFEFASENIALGPLTEEAVRTIAVAATEAAPLRPHELDAIVSRAGGNPLFLEEILKVVRETGDTAQLPETLDAVVSAEIDTLAPLTRQLLRYAAVLGRSFAAMIFDRLIEPEGIVLDDATRADLDRFMERSGDRYRFLLSVVHSAAYHGLSYRRRRELHRRAGLAIEEVAGDDTDAASDVLAFHFSNAGDHEKAWRYARTAAARAKAAYANAQAAAHYETAIEAARQIDVDSSRVAAVWSDLGDVRDLAGEYELAREAFAKALAVSNLDEAVAADLYLKRAEMWYLSGRLSNGRRNLSLGRRRLASRSDPESERARARLDAFEASIRAREGDPVGAAKAARTAIDRAQSADEKKALARAYGVLDWANFMMGIDEPRRGGEAIEIWKSVGQLERAVTLMSNMGAFAYLEGDWNSSVAWYEKSIEAAERTGHVAEDGAANTMANLAEVLVSQRRFDEAIPIIEESARVFISSNVPQALPFVQLQEARAAIGQGRPQTAIDLLEPMLKDQLESGELEAAPDTAVHLARALIDAGRPDEAMEQIDLLALENEDALNEVPPSIARTRGEALLAAGRKEEASRYLSLALEQARAQGDIFEEALVLDVTAEATERRNELFSALGIVH